METRVLDNIEIQLVRKKVKNLSLRVLPPDGEVRLTIPGGISEDEALSFVKAKKKWIIRQKEKISSGQFYQRHSFVDGEEHFLFGKKYSLKVEESMQKEGVQLKDNMICLYVSNTNDAVLKEKVMDRWYRENLLENLPALVNKWENIMNLRVREVKVRDMKTRWGTCNPARKRIWISLMLAKRRPALVEYIVVHEMAHLIERGHNKRFYAVMDKYLPAWKELRKELK